MKTHWNIRFFGSVQGVFFRQFLKDLAGKYNITGLARNEPDGSVYVELEGEEKSLQTFLDICKNYKPAKITDVSKTTGESKNFTEFAIEY
ncbi:hypothetical protein A2645_00610 [Candidatus Nomurabacteria bacterium RIFCSPHIGHO2_01_FULL_39_9]|uniref:acylphosphatase n=1 Tax=Candidatus Nomurabacteria bacterium RIFCSPHIGHO2_01_FULL_39_9 TaxID=1801735 RepID=A0A1F6UWL1_9BACT|nr:MAG: hypothetical protein A2645_00610 [Candidatus Nomurabacteria bacterium RIFCSPHIGHO2_01_FULL_39_9]